MKYVIGTTMAIKKTQQDFDLEVKIINERGIYSFPTNQIYQGTHHSYGWKCEHGHTWPASLVRIKQGHGCPTCGSNITASKNSVPVERFLDHLHKRNSTLPSISYVSGFVGMTKKALFKCDVCGHSWDTLPKSLIRGSGCPECKRINNINLHTYSHDEFTEKLHSRNLISNNKIYIVPGQTYGGIRSKLTFTCEHNHTWSAVPEGILNNTAGCPHCAGVVKRGTTAAFSEITQKWPLLTITSQHGDQLGRREYIEVMCENNHQWDTTYERLISGHYCPHCNGNAKYNQQTFVQKIQNVSPTITVLGQFQQTHIPVDVKCNVCNHEWKPRPYNLIQGYGCPQCSKNNKFSKKALIWLRYLELHLGIKLNHAKRYGEFRIPGTNYRVDGYDPISKTVYEFYGDYWHGNPNMYDPDQYNQHLNKSYKHLYQSTMSRERTLVELGYNVVSVWESDFDQMMTTNFLMTVSQCVDVNEYVLKRNSVNMVELENDAIILTVINVDVPPESDDRKATINQTTHHEKPNFVLFSDELKQRPDLIRRKLSHYTQSNHSTQRIHARSCTIRSITNKEKVILLNTNHVQGNDNSQIGYGAFYEDDLVAVMTFSVPRTGIGVHKNKKPNTFELVRFCTDVNYRIPGIASRLLKHFQKTHKWSEIYSYADKRWSVGNMYEKLGFSLTNDNPPDYFYVINGVRKHRWNYRKDILKNTLPNYDASLTEYQNMVNHGYYRVWDCGTLKYTIINEL